MKNFCKDKSSGVLYFYEEGHSLFKLMNVDTHIKFSLPKKFFHYWYEKV